MFNLTDYIPKKDLTKLCKKYHIKKLSLFGSALHNELSPDSDIDILVEFEKSYVPGLLLFCHIKNELSDSIGREVDLHTANDLSRYFRDDVVKNSKVQYAL